MAGRHDLRVIDARSEYEYLIALGRALDAQDDVRDNEANRISGCQSDVWLAAELQDGRVHILAESDAMITRGIISLLLRVLSDQRPEDIVNTNLYFIDQIGLKPNVSPSRANGLAAIVDGIKHRAQELSP